MSAPEPYDLSVGDDEIDLLKKKLDLVRLPDELDGVGWEYGAPLSDVRRLVARWRDGFDWRRAEKDINLELPQFTVDIEVEGFETLNIHFVHKKSEIVNAIPLLFVHGWPGSFLEVRKFLPLLLQKSPEHPSFHVVALSLPGYGFSQGSCKKGFGIAQYAETGHKLMLKLGYSEYVTQGGDWGFFITRKIAQSYGPAHSKAWHTNMSFGVAPRPFSNPLLWVQHLFSPYNLQEKEGLKRTAWFRNTGHGYFAEQSTQPQTIGYSLADSPVGLLAWIYEKLVTWTDEYPWTDDEVLTWISIYWFSRKGPAASTRIYYEVIHTGEREIAQVTTIPMGLSRFPKEIIIAPRKWTRTTGKLVFESQHTRGGHFAAHEAPDALVADLRKMFGKGGIAYGVVRGKDGY